MFGVSTWDFSGTAEAVVALLLLTTLLTCVVLL
jgi:hypothetical protein